MGDGLNRLGLPDTDGVGGFLKRNWLRLTAVVSSMAGLVLIIAFVGSDPQATEQTNRPDKLTRADTVEFQETQKCKADFDKIQNGWTAAQVETILGSKGLASAPITDPRVTATSCSWFYDCGVIITIVFDRRLIVTGKGIQVLTETMSLDEARDLMRGVQNIRWGRANETGPAF